MDIKIKVDVACVHDGTYDVDSVASNNREVTTSGVCKLNSYYSVLMAEAQAVIFGLQATSNAGIYLIH